MMLMMITLTIFKPFNVFVVVVDDAVTKMVMTLKMMMMLTMFKPG